MQPAGASIGATSVGGVYGPTAMYEVPNIRHLLKSAALNDW